MSEQKNQQSLIMVDLSEQEHSSTRWVRIYLGVLLYTGLLILLLMLFSSRFTP